MKSIHGMHRRTSDSDTNSKSASRNLGRIRSRQPSSHRPSTLNVLSSLPAKSALFWLRYPGLADPLPNHHSGKCWKDDASARFQEAEGRTARRVPRGLFVICSRMSSTKSPKFSTLKAASAYAGTPVSREGALRSEPTSASWGSGEKMRWRLWSASSVHPSTSWRRAIGMRPLGGLFRLHTL